MDEALWGELRNHINLESLIFPKLPLDAFFRFRAVCKDWNRLASDRAFLLDHFSSLQRPWFVVDDKRSGAARLLQRRHAGCWTWTRLPLVKCESDGLLMEDSDSNRVFDLHTRIVHALPPEAAGELAVEEEGDYEEPLVGMIVDTTTVAPYEFRVVLGDEVIPTRIYDSRSGLWTQRESVNEDLLLEPRSGRNISAFCDGILYIKNASLSTLHWYHVERDEWSINGHQGFFHTIYCQNWLTGYDRPAEWVCCDFGEWKEQERPAPGRDELGLYSETQGVVFDG